MRTLFIDTHMFDVNVILFEEGMVFRQKSVSNSRHSSVLVNTIKDVISDEDFDDIWVVNGPGSFTGVRLGVTVAKTLSYTMNKPIKVINYLDFMAVSDSYKQRYYAFDEGNGFYVGDYLDSHNPIYSYFSRNDFQNNVDFSSVCVNGLFDYFKLMNYMETVDYVNCHSVKPVYIKLIGVEIDKKC